MNMKIIAAVIAAGVTTAACVNAVPAGAAVKPAPVCSKGSSARICLAYPFRPTGWDLAGWRKVSYPKDGRTPPRDGNPPQRVGTVAQAW